MSEREKCSVCGGSGESEGGLTACPGCDGSGVVSRAAPAPGDGADPPKFAIVYWTRLYMTEVEALRAWEAMPDRGNYSVLPLALRSARPELQQARCINCGDNPSKGNCCSNPHLVPRANDSIDNSTQNG